MLPQFTSRTLGVRAVVFPPGPLTAAARLGAVGHERRAEPGYDWHGLKRADGEFVLFQYTLRGAGRLRVGTEEREVRAGEAMLLRVPSDHRYWLPAGGSWEFIFVCLHGAEVLRLWAEAGRELGSLVPLAAGGAAVECAARIVTETRRGGVTSAAASAARAFELTACLLAEGAERPRIEASRRARALARAREHARKNLATPLGVAELARAAGMSRFHFSRSFAAETGRTPAAWLASLRVEAAAQWLVQGELPLKEIAARCGFADAQTFGKVFRRHTGRPPGAFRRGGG